MHRLALGLGMTISELRLRMTSRELTDWRAYYHLEPFGEERADLRSGIVASTIANVNRGKDVKPFSPADFMLFKPKKEEEDQEE